MVLCNHHGRNAGHFALGIGKAAGAPLTLIPEEFAERVVSFKEVADILEGSVIKKTFDEKDHGVAVLLKAFQGRLDMNELESLGRSKAMRPEE